MSECDLCGETVPNSRSHQIVHIEQEHPEEYEKMLESYYADLKELQDNE